MRNSRKTETKTGNWVFTELIPHNTNSIKPKFVLSLCEVYAQVWKCFPRGEGLDTEQMITELAQLYKNKIYCTREEIFFFIL